MFFAFGFSRLASRISAALLTLDQIIGVTSDERMATGLDEMQLTAGFTTMLQQGDIFGLGLNAGQWGGGLRQVNLRSGTVTVIRGDTGGDLCGGLLKPDDCSAPLMGERPSMSENNLSPKRLTGDSMTA